MPPLENERKTFLSSFSIKMNAHFHKQNYNEDKTKIYIYITKYNNINK